MILVRIALGSAVLSVPFSRRTTKPHEVFSTSLASPSPYAVASSITATVLADYLQKLAIAGPC